MSEQVKVYITTYALSQGIYECLGEVHGQYFRPADLYVKGRTVGKDCFYTLDEAIDKAKTMAQRRLKSLEAKKQKINKLLDGGFKVNNI